MTFRKSSFEQDPMEATGSFTGTFDGAIESASFAETASFALNAGGGGDESLESGVPATIDGVAVGFTDFSEFAITSTRPSGITFFASGGQPDPTSESIRLDVDEGQYFSIDGHGQSLWAYGVDAFDGILEFGELLARIWITDAGTNLRDMGPALSVTGTLQAETSFMNAHVVHLSPTNFDSNLSRVISGGNGSFIGGDLQEAAQENAWAWMRYRRTASSDPDFDDMEVRTWYGDIEDEPASPDVSSLGVFGGTSVARGKHALGWGGFVIPLLEQKVAYLAYSDDPVAVPPPIPLAGPSGDFSGSFSGSVTGTFVGELEATGTLTGTLIGSADTAISTSHALRADVADAGTGSFTGSFIGEFTGSNSFTGSFTGAVGVLSSGSGKGWARSTGSDVGGSFNALDFTLGEFGSRFGALVDELLVFVVPPPGPQKPIIASPQIEYDARITQENPIVTLEDQSGQGNDATAVGTPQYEANGWDFGLGAFRLENNEALTFDGTPFVGTEFTWFIVFEAIDLSPETVLLGGTTGTTNQNLHIVIFSSGAIRFAFWANDITTAGGLVTAGSRHILTGRHSNSSGRILRLDGVEVAADGGKTTDLTAWGGSAVGRKQSVFGLDKRIAWIGGYSSAASNGEIVEMEAFLNFEFF